MPELFDVIVAGGGPSGASAAYRLAASGRSVLVFEKSEMPRDKLCGGAVSEQALHYLDFTIPPELHEWECFGARVHYGGRSVEARSDTRVAVLVSRARFDKFLLDRARDKGAKVRFEQVRSLDVREDRVVVTADGESCAARIGIIANGAAGGLSRLVRPKDRQEEFGYCLEQAYPRRLPVLPASADGLVDIFFGVSGFGYGWVFPHGSHASIGVGGLSSQFRNPRGAMRRFWAENCGLPVDELKPRGWPLPCGGIKRPLAAHRLILAGDAAGFVDAFTGEGIAYAIRSGQLAADVAAGALSTADCSAEFLSRSVRASYAEIHASLRYSLWIARLMHSYPAVLLSLLATEPRVLRKHLLIAQDRLSYRGFFLWLIARLPFLSVRLLVPRRRAAVTV